MTLDDLALLAEFDGDDDAVDELLQALEHGYPAEHVAERIRQDRADTAEHQRLVAEFESAGVAVTASCPTAPPG